MLIHNSILVENKAVRALSKAHEVQLVNYLVATEIDIGLLLNFGAPRLQVKRKSRHYRSRSRAKQSEQDERD
jgi:GxxExxY protein